jgi:superfamily II DNA or RNA helicase
MLTLESPVRLALSEIDTSLLAKELRYIDQKVDFEIKKHKHASWFINKYGQEAWQEKLDELKASRQKSLLFEDTSGFWTYSGLVRRLASKYQQHTDIKVLYPESDLIPWHKKPDKVPRGYQEEIVKKLLEAKHGAVEVGTGLGKSFCALLLAKHHGLQTVVMTPSRSIGAQIYGEFLSAFGAKYVGMFGDGKKEYKKLFTIAISNSLALLEPGKPAYETLSKASVFIADESHLCPAQTLARVCFGLMADVPYRYFFSGTQLRGDGLDLLLEAITGEIVFRMSVREGVEQGWLAKPLFRVINLDSRVNFYKDDPNAMTRAHLYYNPDVNAIAGDLVNQLVADGRQVVVLIEEVEQFAHLLPHIKHELRFAHGGTTKDNADKVPQKYKAKPNVTALVDDFNSGEYPVLIGTSCIGTGTDIQTVGAIVYLQGGRSEIQVKQAIGRGTRKPPGKTDCYFFDFDVHGNDVTHRHALARREIYEEVYPDLAEVSL